MFKTILNAVLLYATQNAFGHKMLGKPMQETDEQGDFSYELPDMPISELIGLIDAELDSGIYNIGDLEGQCSRKSVVTVLRDYFQRQHRCH